MLKPVDIFDIICSHAARHGRDEKLFGKKFPLAREAIAHSLAGTPFSGIWFEVPLLGAPRFDLHVCLSGETIKARKTLPADFIDGDFNAAFELYADRKKYGNCGFALAFDISEGKTKSHALHLIDTAPFCDVEKFFEAVGSRKAAEHFLNFVERAPKAWHVWYYGLLTARADKPLRIDFFVSRAAKEACAKDISLLARHLKDVGFSAVSDTFLARTKELAAMPFAMELQFDVLADGSTSSTIGTSFSFGKFPKEREDIPAGDIAEHTESAQVIFCNSSAAEIRKDFEQGDVAALMEKIQSWGLADERWHLLPEASFSKRLALGAVSLEIVNRPRFVKLRYKEGKPFDAKVYFQAQGSQDEIKHV